MPRWCDCNQPMNLELHTVIFAKKIEVKNVPIFSCMSCSTYEVLKPVKAHLTEYLQTIELSLHDPYQVVIFSDIDEVASLFCDLYKRNVEMDLEKIGDVVEVYKEERINLLLDVYQCALQMNDEGWMSDTQRRLEQLSQFHLEEHLSEAG
ncbi:hypothetical protein PV403_17100 [Paenibacillus sp. GYB006]|uniref:hypothetical protein n=1 Tax=Paenibacillus sp. GYB006 TaxID=2994394 RepID=UPI002F96A4E9